jgi:peptidoglycan/LPS O-acetylase OafA/YrhL
MISFIKKGNGYITNFLSHRFIRLLPAFFIANIGYLCLLSLIDNTNAFISILEMRDGITPLPSSWFIYTIIYFYLAFYLIARLFQKKTHMLIALWGLSFVYVIIVRLLGWGNYWFMSVYALNIGQCYAFFEDKIKSKLIESSRLIITSIWSLFILFLIVWTINQFVEITTFNRLYYCFTAIFIVYSIYVLGEIPSKTLRFIGKISYEFYLVQGIFIQLLEFLKDQWIIYFCIVYLSSIVTAWILHNICVHIINYKK